MNVSVIIPTYGRPLALRSAVASALAQGAICAEIIVVDDASVEPITQKMLPLDPRIRIIRKAVNCGPAAARNLGIRSAKGSIIAFLDSDDLWFPNKLISQLIHGNPEANVAIATGWIQKRKSKYLQFLPSKAASLADFARGCWFSPGSTLVVRKDAFNQIGFFDERLRRLEDFEWFLRFGAAGGRLEVVSRPLVRIGWHRTTKPALVKEALAIISNDYLRAGSPSYMRDRYMRRCVRAYLSMVLASAHIYSHQPLPGILTLLHSFMLHPRIGVQSRDLLQRTQFLPE